MGLILRYTCKCHRKDPDKSTLSWIFQVLPPKFSLGSEQLHTGFFYSQNLLELCQKLRNSEAGSSLREGGCGAGPWRRHRGGCLLLWSHVSSSGEDPGRSGSAHPGPGRAVTSFLARCGAASSPGTGDRAQWEPAPGLVGALRALERKSTDALTGWTLELHFKNWFCCTELNSYLISIKVKSKTSK